MLRLLRSVGKARFVQYYYQFRNDNEDEIINLLIQNNVSNYNGARRRVINAKELFRLHLEEQAIQNIISSSRLNHSIRQQAELILGHL